MSELDNIVRKILKNGKGILAADESTGTMTRLDSVKVPSTLKIGCYLEKHYSVHQVCLNVLEV